jgi:hypothetical protein
MNLQPKFVFAILSGGKERPQNIEESSEKKVFTTYKDT